MLDTAKDLLRYMEWADALIWRTVLSAPAAMKDADLKERLYHIHVTQHAFLQVWIQVTRQLPPSDSFDTAALARWVKTFYEEANSDAAWLDESTLQRAVPESLMAKARAGLGAGTAVPTIGDTVFQVIFHTTHHRGQIRQRLRELRCAAPLTEYFVWSLLGKPNADWPA